MTETAQPQPATLIAELLFDRAAPTPAEDELVAALARHDRTAKVVQQEGGALMIAHQQWFVEGPGGQRVPLVTACLAPNDGAERPLDVTQSWLFSGAAVAAASTVERRLVVQMMGLAHDPEHRRAAFLAGLRAAVDAWAPHAISFPLTVQVLSAEQVLTQDLLPFVNVRLFTVADADELVMDTLGLGAFGLPDLQCRFSGLEPDAVARVLYATAAYVLERGDVFEDGHTVTGLDEDDHWAVRHAPALVDPARTVLDLDPGLSGPAR